MSRLINLGEGAGRGTGCPKPTVIDLFAGAGGLSYGFKMAGYSIVCAIEQDTWASDTYSLNNSEVEILCNDIRNIPDEKLARFSGVDVVMGGPPCQGFSISASNRRKLDDERNYLYRHFLRAIEIIKPRAVLIENVKEIMSAKLSDRTPILEDIKVRINRLGYSLDYGLLNASDFGVPQERHRFFLIASMDQKPKIENIQKTHGKSDLFTRRTRHLTLWDAISDLPIVEPFQLDEDACQPYDKPPTNAYQELMREGSDEVCNHIPMRHGKRMVERFKQIPIGGDMDDVPNEYRARIRNTSILSGKVYSQNHRRLIADEPSKTITASFYSSFIHPYQNRNLTVREAARIQSFPDCYRFTGKKTKLSHKLLFRKGVIEDMHLDQFNQVGNAIPPLLGKVLADYINLNLLKLDRRRVTCVH